MPVSILAEAVNDHPGGVLGEELEPGRQEPVLIVGPGKDRSNVTDAFTATDLEIVAMSGEMPRLHGGGGWRAPRDPWKAPSSREDYSLQALWERRDKEGWWLAEVPVGAGAPRRLDAAIVTSEGPRVSAANNDLNQLRDVVAKGGAVELVEAKARLDEEVIGQLLCGAPMFKTDYPGTRKIRLTACVRARGDEALEWFASEHGINVEQVSV